MPRHPASPARPRPSASSARAASSRSSGTPDRTERGPAVLPLSVLLTGCADAVAAVRGGRSLNDALAACRPAERPGVQALSFTVLRRLGMAQTLRKLLVPKAPQPWVEALLLSALALACGTEYDPHTLVDQAVEAAKRRAKPASGFVNAVLRRFLREREPLTAQASADPVARYNHPAWWIERLRQDWPGQWEAILHANQVQPPMTLRVNTRRTSVQAYLRRLAEAGLLPPSAAAPDETDTHGAPAGAAESPETGAQIGPHPIALPAGVPVERLPGFAEGDVSVQDAAAQIAAPLLTHAEGRPLPPGARVLDACAAPGGKTAHLLECGDFEVTAVDADPQRLARVTDTLSRLQLAARTLAADASHPTAWWDGRPYDAILLDAPCSASGIVRRHPDVRWLRREGDIAALARAQDSLLDALWPLLRPGGRLLYCTCSVFKAEGQERADAFLQRTPDARALPSPGYLLPVVEYPETASRPSGDGFFYALFSKAAQARSAP